MADSELMSRMTMSSRVRLARNVASMPFPGRLKAELAQKLVSRAQDAFFGSSAIDAAQYMYIDVQSMDAVDRMMLVERRIISQDLAAASKPCAAIMKKDETLSVMINEEDHFRVQCTLASDDIDAACEACAAAERALDACFEMAFDERLGYLTSCPTNLGTGMRASFMLHLPALAMTGCLKSVLESCAKIGIAVRGMYGEHSEATGNLFQFSNQNSLGRSEGEIIEFVKDVRAQVAAYEERLREGLFKQGRTAFEDRVCRALGTLRYARRLTSDEYMRLWSDVRLGADMGAIPGAGVDVQKLDALLTRIQPAYIQKVYGRMLNTEERDVQRANLVREQLAGLA